MNILQDFREPNYQKIFKIPIKNAHFLLYNSEI